MAWTEFYMQTTGSDLNAGSTTADAASLTYASGNWVAATGVFTVASGDPATDGVLVGDWVSVYVDGDSATPFIGKVTARDATTITVDITTDKAGTPPTDGTGNRSLKVGGAWASLGLCASGRLFAYSTALLFSARINIKAGTYANTTTNRAIVLAGSVTIPVWFRGYESSPGDLDDMPTVSYTPGTTCPHFTWTSNGFSATTSSKAQRFSGISFLATTYTFSLYSNTGGTQYIEFINCLFEHQNAAANSSAASVTSNTGGVIRFCGCWFKATSSATQVVSATIFVAQFYGCVVTGGGHGIVGSTQTLEVHDCLIYAVGGDGLRMTTGRLTATGNAIYSTGSDGIEFAGNPSANTSPYIANNIFENIGGYVINNATGTNITNFAALANSYYSATSGLSAGIGDQELLYTVVETASHFTNAAGGDFSLVSTSTAKAAGFPQLLMGTTVRNYKDLGASQRQEAGGGSGPVPKFGPSGEGPSFKGVLA